jgi:putative FmdB family regulatory protein
MPTYDYMCESCGHEFEQFQSIKARPIRRCPRCGKTALKRLIGVGAAVIFKGPGFYQTDYRTESYKKAAEKEKTGTTTKSSEKKETKTETKAASTESKTKTGPSEKKKTA